MAKPPICRNCVHSIIDIFDQSCTAGDSGETSLVTGQQLRRGVKNCHEERGEFTFFERIFGSARCGPEGRNFVAASKKLGTPPPSGDD